MGHHLQNIVALVADQGQFVERGFGSRRVVAFNLVFNRLNQGGFGELFFFVVDIGWLAHGQAPWVKVGSLTVFRMLMLLASLMAKLYNSCCQPQHGLEAL